jgi:ubiquinone/menaquinone biosynthesis C-methylase UbiE
MGEEPRYVLGSDDAEIARLDQQASAIAGATDAVLRAAGVAGPLRVLDLGTGLGHVAFQVARLLDSEGSVLGVDAAERLLTVAEQRRAAAQLSGVAFVRADVREFAASERFDAIVARLLLFHLPDRAVVLRRQLDALAAGGTMILIESDMGAMRAEPPVPLVDAVRRWVEAAFRSAGADPRLGARAALVRSLAPQIRAHGIADDAELELDTLEARIAEQVAARDAVVLAPTVVGAWGAAPGQTG